MAQQARHWLHLSIRKLYFFMFDFCRAVMYFKVVPGKLHKAASGFVAVLALALGIMSTVTISYDIIRSLTTSP